MVTGKASSFADPADIRSFERCKANGGSDQECFKVGDNGIGYYGESTKAGSGPSCAISPEDIIEKFGSANKGSRATVRVTIEGKSILCLLKDHLPHKNHIQNGVVIDLNPDAVAALNQKIPLMKNVEWEWVD